MSDLFLIGAYYENRKGRYIVASIDGDEMNVRYENGESETLNISLQAPEAVPLELERSEEYALRREYEGCRAQKHDLSCYAARSYT